MKNIITSLLISLLLFSPSFAAWAHDHDHDHHEEVEDERGAHGGKIYSDSNFSVEMVMKEDGTPPRFQIYAYFKEKPLSPSSINIKAVLERFGGIKETISFSSTDDYLLSDQVIEELHSFIVRINASYEEKEYSIKYDSFEGRTTLSEKALSVAKLKFAIASSSKISNSTQVFGKILPNEDKVAHIGPRFAGIVKEIRKTLGDHVKAGDVLAIVESNQGLQSYEIRAQLAGVITYRHASIGEAVSESQPLFVVTDLSSVWADFQVYRDDFEKIEVGQQIFIDIGNSSQKIEAKVSYVSPLTDEATQSKLIRAILPNEDSRLRPGLFVTGMLTSSELEVPVAVERAAIQTFRDKKVVYLTDGHTFQAAPVELGRFDSKFIEVLSGISNGQKYVSEGSFIIKADIEKSGASHDH